MVGLLTLVPVDTRITPNTKHLHVCVPMFSDMEGEYQRRVIAERDPKKIQEKMLKIDYSFSENWGISGIDGAGFWSRWYLWSYPNFEGVSKFMSKRFGIKRV